jgi:hypothetical protein
MTCYLRLYAEEAWPPRQTWMEEVQEDCPPNRPSFGWQSSPSSTPTELPVYQYGCKSLIATLMPSSLTKPTEHQMGFCRKLEIEQLNVQTFQDKGHRAKPPSDTLPSACTLSTPSSMMADTRLGICRRTLDCHSPQSVYSGVVSFDPSVSPLQLS